MTACVPNPLFSPGSGDTTGSTDADADGGKTSDGRPTSAGDGTNGSRGGDDDGATTMVDPDDSADGTATTVGTATAGTATAGDGQDGDSDETADDVSLSLSPCEDAPSLANLQACWNFEDVTERGGSLIVWDTVASRPLEFLNPDQVEPALWGSGLALSNLDSLPVVLPNQPIPGAGYRPYTLELWLSSSPDDWANQSAVFSVEGPNGSVASVRLGVGPMGPSVTFETFDSTTVTPTEEGEFTHCVALTLDAQGQATAYFRSAGGVLAVLPLGDAAGGDVGGARILQIGADTSGFVDGIRWWNTALSLVNVCLPEPP